MNTTTYYHHAATRPAPTPYLTNVVRAAQSLLKALFPVHPARIVAKIHDRTEILRVANAYRNTAPSLSQELMAIACRDD